MRNRTALASYIEELISFIDNNRVITTSDNQIALLRYRLTEDYRAATWRRKKSDT